MAYKQKINPRTGKFNLLNTGGGGSGSGIQEVTSTDESVSVTDISDGVDLSVRPIIKHSISQTSDYDNVIPSVKSVIDYVNQERGKLEAIYVSQATDRYKRFIEVSPENNTTYYRLTAMVMGGSGNPDWYGMLEISFGYQRQGSNPDYCYAYWLAFTEGDPSKQTYKTPPVFKIWVSSDKKKLIVGAKCPSNSYQTLELDIVTENTIGSKIHGSNSNSDLISTDFISAAREIEIVDLSNQYSLPIASNSTLGGVKTGAAITETQNMSAVSIKDGILYFKNRVLLVDDASGSTLSQPATIKFYTGSNLFDVIDDNGVIHQIGYQGFGDDFNDDFDPTIPLMTQDQLTAGTDTSAMTVSPKLLADNIYQVGSTNKASTKLFLVGASAQGAKQVGYSNNGCYIGADGCLYSGGVKVLTSHQSLANYALKSEIPTVPTTVSSFANDAGYTKKSDLPMSFAFASKNIASYITGWIPVADIRMTVGSGSHTATAIKISRYSVNDGKFNETTISMQMTLISGVYSVKSISSISSLDYEHIYGYTQNGSTITIYAYLDHEIYIKIDAFAHQYSALCEYVANNSDVVASGVTEIAVSDVVPQVYSVGNLSYTASNKRQCPTINTLAYWDGQFISGYSNLKYCDRGRFGDVVTHSVSEFIRELSVDFSSSSSVSLTLAEISGIGRLRVKPNTSSCNIILPTPTGSDITSYAGHRLDITIVPTDSSSRVLLHSGVYTLYTSSPGEVCIIVAICTGSGWKTLGYRNS